MPSQTAILDAHYMARALELARKGVYSTHPNPRVGCVIVRDGEVVGEGWHVRAGEPHAEVHALRQAGERARGACAYVTLEPCSHHGQVDILTINQHLANGAAIAVFLFGLHHHNVVEDECRDVFLGPLAKGLFLFRGVNASEPDLVEAPPWGVRERLSLEKTAIGFYLSGHLFDGPIGLGNPPHRNHLQHSDNGKRPRICHFGVLTLAFAPNREGFSQRCR